MNDVWESYKSGYENNNSNLIKLHNIMCETFMLLLNFSEAKACKMWLKTEIDKIEFIFDYRSIGYKRLYNYDRIDVKNLWSTFKKRNPLTESNNKKLCNVINSIINKLKYFPECETTSFFFRMKLNEMK